MKNIFLCLVFSVHILVINCKYEQSCETHLNCTDPNEVCLDGSCDCREFSTYDQNFKKCLPDVFEYGGSCFTDLQCKHLKETVSDISCRNNKCICDKNMRWFGGKCWKYTDLNGDCETNENCFNGYDLQAMVCKNKKCQCSDNYYERDGDCRIKSGLCKECAISLDCKKSNDEELSCMNGLCRKVETDCTETNIEFPDHKKSQKTNILKEMKDDDVKCSNGKGCIYDTNSEEFDGDAIECSEDKDCMLDNMICNEKKCECEDKYYLSDNGYCVFGIRNCTNNDDCGPTATCSNEISCICKPGYFIKDHKCVPELGIPLSQNEKKCNHIQAAVLDIKKNACYCKNTWFTDFNNQNCFKTSTETNNNCLSNEWCLFMGKNSYCKFEKDSIGQCVCIDGEPNKNFYCEKKMESDCFSEIDCKLNMKCVNRNCVCSDGFYSNAHGECAPKIGSSCFLQDCEGQDVHCKQGICSCESSFVTNSSKLDCFEKRGVNEECQIDNQCTSVTNNTLCAGTCKCKSDYKEFNLTCFKKKYFGSFCSTKEDCTNVLDKDWVCRNNMCQCPVGHKVINEVKCSSATSIKRHYLIFATNLLFLVLSLNKLFDF